VVTAAKERVYWIDALKAVVVVGIALFHASLVFAPGSWVVNNAERTFVLGGFAAFTFQWGIALMFVLAGAATWFGLRSRGARHFASTRMVRLGLPLVLGIAVLSPIQNYVEYHRPLELGGLLRNYVTFWGSVPINWSPASGYGYVFHLWFLTHLLAISLLTLPVALWLRSAAGRRLVERLLPIGAAPGGMLLLVAFPLAVVQMALHARFPSYEDWSDIASWSVLYLTGFVLISDRRFTEILRRRGSEALIGALVASLSIGLLFLSGNGSSLDSHPQYSPGYLAYQALRSVNTWGWVMFFLCVGVRWLNSDNLLTSWGAEMPMPFYVLSHPVVVVIAAYVVAWDVGLWAKFVVLTVLAIGITLILCEGVRRSRVLRVVFGLSAVERPRHPSGPMATGKESLRPNVGGMTPLPGTAIADQTPSQEREHMLSDQPRPFRDRREAGMRLAARLVKYHNRPGVLVLAIPRGGVPVGYEVATALAAPLDVVVVRKLGLPGQPELAMGAVASGGVRVLNPDVVQALRIPDRIIDSVAAREMVELERRELMYRGKRAGVDPSGLTVILVDDGLATGSSMQAAIAALRARGAASVVVAVPVGPPSTCREIASLADDFICPNQPALFEAVGEWYADFAQTTDEEVRQLLETSSALRTTAAPQSGGTR
jgi:putative phosphoribosyl transferase